jgi:hypothetical protein
MSRGKRALAALDDDIREHIERETQENIDRGGMAPEEACRQAMLKFAFQPFSWKSFESDKG